MAGIEGLVAQLGATALAARKRAIVALQEDGSADAARAIVAAMEGDPRLYEPGGAALGEMGANAVTPILERLSAVDSILASWLMGALSRIGAPAVEPLRAELAKATSPETRDRIVRAMGQLQANGRPLLDDLAPLVRDEALRGVAVASISLIGIEAALVPALIACLGDDDATVRRDAARALGTAEAQTPEIVAALAGLAADPSASVRDVAADSLRLLAKRETTIPARVPSGSAERRARAIQLHQRVLRHNWDHGVAALRRIVRDPDCDRGTALRAYWMGRPEWYVQFATRSEAGADHEIWDLLEEIERRVAEGFYALSNIPFDPSCDDDGSSWIGLYPDVPRLRKLPDAMYRAV